MPSQFFWGSFKSGDTRSYPRNVAICCTVAVSGVPDPKICGHTELWDRARKLELLNRKAKARKLRVHEKRDPMAWILDSRSGEKFEFDSDSNLNHCQI